MIRSTFKRRALYLAPLATAALLACGASDDPERTDGAAGTSSGGTHSSAGAPGTPHAGASGSGPFGSAGAPVTMGAAGSSTNGGANAAGGAPATSGGTGGGVTSNGGANHGGASHGGASNGGAGSGSAGAHSSGGSTGMAGAGNVGSHWIPAKNTTFYWDLVNSPPDNTKNVGAYDIDGFGNSAAEVTALHAKGIKVVCYMDLGTFEPGRPDSASFTAAMKGKGVDGWPGEFWLDVRAAGPNIDAVKAIMLARFKVCQQKGFDAVEPDNLDSYQNKPGFTTTAADQLAYNKWIAATVHSLGMAVFQKNDLDQVEALEPFFDGILDEECNKYTECDTLAPYTAAGKPVWDAEYKEDGETTAKFCPANIKAGIVGALFALDLDGSLFEPCSNDVGVVN